MLSHLRTVTAWAVLRLEELKHREEGQGLVEYALIIVLVSIASIVALGALGVKISGIFDDITQAL